jgi:hypothetical protein
MKAAARGPLPESAYNCCFFTFTRMTALGISLIVIGSALVCVGTLFWRRTSRTGRAGADGLPELRAIIDALEIAFRRMLHQPNRPRGRRLMAAPCGHGVLFELDY